MNYLNIFNNYKMNRDLLNKLIYPYTSNFDEEYQKYYYYNTKTKESVWKLPEE